jgi:CBS domain-containing protein
MEFQTAQESYPPPSSMVPTISVQRLLDTKGAKVWSIGPDERVLGAVELMAEHHVGALLVMAADTLVGIITERDYARRVVLEQRASKDTAVRDIMTRKVTTVGSKHSLQDCMKLMTEGRFRHLPVVDKGKVVGVVSIGDVVKASLAHQNYLLDELERYIAW